MSGKGCWRRIGPHKLKNEKEIDNLVQRKKRKKSYNGNYQGSGGMLSPKYYTWIGEHLIQIGKRLMRHAGLLVSLFEPNTWKNMPLILTYKILTECLIPFIRTTSALLLTQYVAYCILANWKSLLCLCVYNTLGLARKEEQLSKKQTEVHIFKSMNIEPFLSFSNKYTRLCLCAWTTKT